MGNVQLTIWVEQDRSNSIVSYNVGHGPVNKTGKFPSSHWTATAAPNQLVTVIAAHEKLGDSGRLFVQVVQNNNGRILCTDDNHENRKAAATCNGIVVI
jgi:hypothetical protein